MEPADYQSVAMAVPGKKRTTLRKLASKTKILSSTLHDALKRESINRRRITLKPLLTGENKMERMKFALSFVRHVLNKIEYIFESMCNMVHVDEKTI